MHLDDPRMLRRRVGWVKQSAALSGLHDYVEGQVRVMVPEPGVPGLALRCAQPRGGTPFFARHAYASAAVVLVRAGRGRLWAVGRAISIEPGMLISCPPGGVELYIEAPHEIDVIALPERVRSETGAWRTIEVPLVRRLDALEVDAWSKRLADCAELIAADAFDDAAAGALHDALMERFWLGRNGIEIVGATLDAMHARLDRIVSLERLAADVGYTRNYLNDITRDATGVSLGTWLGGMRMAQARHLLVGADVPIADVAGAIGYGDPAYFARAFRRFHGVPPIVWRIAHRADDPRRAQVVGSKESALAGVVPLGISA